MPTRTGSPSWGEGLVRSCHARFIGSSVHLSRSCDFTPRARRFGSSKGFAADASDIGGTSGSTTTMVFRGTALESRGNGGLYFMFYNFARVHQTIRVTPAMEAGLSDHVWSMEEIVGLLDAAEKKQRS